MSTQPNDTERVMQQRPHVRDKSTSSPRRDVLPEDVLHGMTHSDDPIAREIVRFYSWLIS